ncbi:hypothetical protein MAPG_06133 [Magnaporthiopsis poae ATCC 64411]|uniref:Uncharacterized protein n=1 Tax=Magnaporthiopsis poae (strain ATCC 64411 / 73-15) TaxID=644358 RepID=A0A0C4E180_MAGP6|nr:hypothetical protein MAPG_06133 [Magnaporthiopsis poae ATCC 64411]
MWTRWVRSPDQGQRVDATTKELPRQGRQTSRGKGCTDLNLCDQGGGDDDGRAADGQVCVGVPVERGFDLAREEHKGVLCVLCGRVKPNRR